MSEFHENNDRDRQLRLGVAILQKLQQVAAGEAIIAGMNIYHVDRAAEAVRERAKLANATLEEIGVTEADLQQLVKVAPVNVARKIIERIESGIYEYGDDENLTHCLSTGATVADLGIDETGVTSLIAKYHTLHGTNMIETIRNGGRLLRRQQSKGAGINYLRKWADEQGVALADIGTTDEELSLLSA